MNKKSSVQLLRRKIYFSGLIETETALRGFYFGLVGVQNANVALCLLSAFANTFTYVCIVLTACSAAPKESMNVPQGVDTLYS